MGTCSSCLAPDADVYPENIEAEAAIASKTFRVLVGPVVGSVDCSCGRILLETNLSGVVELVATAKGGSKKVLKRTVKGYKPTIFEFQGLSADANYTVDIKGPEPLPFARQAFLKTRPIKRGRMLRFATVSCNNVFIDNVWGGIDLWEGLLEQVKGGSIDAVLHCGDQVYIDQVMSDAAQRTRFRASSMEKENILPNSSTIVQDIYEVNEQPATTSPWKKAMALLDETPEEWEALHRATIIDLFREAYRITWSQPGTAAVLSRVSNYMVMDDHEICNNWGDFLEDDFVMRPLNELRKAFPKKSEKWMLETRKKFFCARCAFEVCYEYQYALRPHEDNPYHMSPSSLHTWNDVGLLLLETRAATTFLRKDCPLTKSGVKEEMLGQHQMELVERALFADDGRFGPDSGIRNLIVVSPVPFAFMAASVNQKLAKFADDLHGHWSSPRFARELQHLLDLCHKWVNADVQESRSRHKVVPSGVMSLESVKDLQPLRRQITLVSGEIHIGLRSRIFADHEGKMASKSARITKAQCTNPRTGFDQLVSSAMRHYYPPIWMAKLTNKVNQKFYRDQMCPNYKARHLEFVQQNNFGIIDIDMEGVATCRLVTKATVDDTRLIRDMDINEIVLERV